MEVGGSKIEMLRILQNARLSTPNASIWDISSSLDPSIYSTVTVSTDINTDYLCPRLNHAFFTANASTDLLTLAPRIVRSIEGGSNVHLLFDTGGSSLKALIKFEIEVLTLLSDKLGDTQHGLAVKPIETHEQVIHYL
jgi:hypothetical protein